MGILDKFIPITAVTPSLLVDSKQRIIKPSVTLFEWETPERLFKKKDKEFYRKIAVIIVFFAMMLLIIKEFVVIIILGIVFGVIYAFTSIPPAIVKHKITTNGIEYASQVLYAWESLTSFYIDKDNEVDILVVNTKDVLPGRLLLLLTPEVDQIAVSKKLNEFISIVENPEKNMYNEFVRNIGRKLNI